MNDFEKQINKLLVGDELIKELMVLPPYRSDIISTEDRLLALLDIYKIFIPTKTTVEIYNQVYLSLVSSLERKGTLEEIKLLNDNFKIIKGFRRYGLTGGLESFRITGQAGIGKSSSIQRVVDIISNNKIIKTDNPPREIIPILIIECVADGSFKNLLYSILLTVDSILGTTYFKANNNVTSTVDMLLSAVSNVLINHVALLAIDECERMANDSRKGETLINYLTQLVNQSNISICFIGNESCNSYFQNKEYLARRTTGISIQRMKYDDYFYNFVKVLFNYQYVLNKVELDGGLVRELYSLSNGLPSLVVSLFVEVQKSAILLGEERITIKLMRSTFEERFSNMSPFIKTCDKSFVTPVKKESPEVFNVVSATNESLFKTLALLSKKNISKYMELLKKNVIVEMVKL